MTRTQILCALIHLCLKANSVMMLLWVTCGEALDNVGGRLHLGDIDGGPLREGDLQLTTEGAVPAQTDPSLSILF